MKGNWLQTWQNGGCAPGTEYVPRKVVSPDFDKLAKTAVTKSHKLWKMKARGLFSLSPREQKPVAKHKMGPTSWEALSGVWGY